MTAYNQKNDLFKFASKTSDFNNQISSNIKSRERSESIYKKSLQNENESFFSNRRDDYENLHSTSQLTNIDFSKFENHVFFDSAESKTNYAFSKIINDFPYDNREEIIEQFLVDIDGYTNYIFQNQFVGYAGYGNFLDNFYLDCKITSDNKNKNIRILEKDTTIQFWINPYSSSSNHIIAQKMHKSSDDLKEGFSITCESVDEIYSNICLYIFNGQNTLKTSVTVEKNKFTNVTFKTSNTN